MADDPANLANEIEQGLREAIQHRKGQIALETRVVQAITAARVKEIRKSVAKSPREFSARFGIPARTLEGWEQGRKLAVADRVLLTVIAKDPEAVERALTGR